MSGVCDVWVGGERGSEEVGERGLVGGCGKRFEREWMITLLESSDR